MKVKEIKIMVFYSTTCANNDFEENLILSDNKLLECTTKRIATYRKHISMMSLKILQ